MYFPLTKANWNKDVVNIPSLLGRQKFLEHKTIFKGAEPWKAEVLTKGVWPLYGFQFLV